MSSLRYLFDTMAMTTDCHTSRDGGLQVLVDGGANCTAAISALGGCISHLRSILLDRCANPHVDSRPNLGQECVCTRHIHVVNRIQLHPA